MSLSYDEYLYKHVQNVNKALNWMRDNLDIDQHYKYEVDPSLMQSHDASKYSKEEYGAYDAYFYDGNRSYQVVKDFDYAWLHHIHNNPHHWQYWVLLEDDPETKAPYKALEIPMNYILEMIADWWSFSWASGNLYEIFDWYKEHKDKQIMHPNSRKIVEGILQQIRDILDREKEESDTLSGEAVSESEEAAEHDGIKGMHWGHRRWQYYDGRFNDEGKRRYFGTKQPGLYDKASTKKDEPKKGYDSSVKSETSTKATQIGGGGAALTTYEDWEKELYKKMLESGETFDIANMTEDQFKKLLATYGVKAEGDISAMMKKASTGYDTYKKYSEGGSGSGSSGDKGSVISDKFGVSQTKTKEKKSGSSGSGSSKGSSSSGSGKASSASSETSASTTTAEDTAAASRSKLDDIMSKAYEAVKKKMADNPEYKTDDIFGESNDNFLKNLEELTGEKLSDLKISELENLKNHMKTHYAEETWEKTFQDKMDDIIAKHPESIENDSAFGTALQEFTGIDTDLLSASKLKEMREKFAEFYRSKKKDLEHSDDLTHSDEGLYGIPELKKYPMPDEKHVKSAIRFFNYVDQAYEKELAEAILEKMDEYGMSFDDFNVGDENRFKKYIPRDDEEEIKE